MTWRLAKSLETLRAQINTMFPSRAKASDGTIGDAAHASRDSDHNPWVKDGAMGVVTALDITCDAGDGADTEALAETLRLQRDPRIKYVIYDKRIFSACPAHGKPAWTWRRYTGRNPHTKHFHVSVQPVKSLYDSTVPWKLTRNA